MSLRAISFLSDVNCPLEFSIGFEVEFFRNNRQRFESPEAVFLLVDILRHLELDNMADRRGDDVSSFS